MQSAGLLMYRKDEIIYVYLVHPGGPFFKNKDKGWWTIPKGLTNPGEDLLAGAIREFTEETGIIPEAPFTDLGQIKQKGGKTVHCWAFEKKDFVKINFKSNTFSIEWPPSTGKIVTFPEVDKAEWMNLETSKIYINERQKLFIERLIDIFKTEI